jgi:hypothetical protein
MAREFFDYDPLTGVKTEFDYDGDTGKVEMYQSQDVERALEIAKVSRDNGLRDNGIKENWFHYAEIPLVYLLKIRKMGIQWDDPKEINRAVNTYFPELKMTQKKEGGKIGQTFLPNRTVEALAPTETPQLVIP